MSIKGARGLAGKQSPGAEVSRSVPTEVPQLGPWLSLLHIATVRAPIEAPNVGGRRSWLEIRASWTKRWGTPNRAHQPLRARAPSPAWNGWAESRHMVQLMLLHQLATHLFDIDFHGPYVEVAGAPADEGNPRPIRGPGRAVIVAGVRRDLYPLAAGGGHDP